jgi:rubredoxin
MADDDYLQTIAERMSPDDFEAFVSLRREIRTCRNTVDTLDTQLSAIARKYGVPGLDGFRAGSTLAIRDKLGASGLNINSWWAKCSPDWRCPCCNRVKADCARLDSKGNLLGKLAAHHDHMREFLDNALAECARIDGMENAALNEASTRILRRFADGLVRFDDVVICEDCNNADPKAKKLVTAPRYFTFTPTEIGTFILPQPNKAHDVDEQQARKTYARATQMFDVRVEATMRLARLVLSGRHWYEHQDYSARPGTIERGAASALAMFGLAYSSLSKVESILLEAPPKKTIYDSWRKVPRRPPSPPTTNDLTYLVASGNAAWNSVPDSWRCPCCSRSKQETIRPSKKFSWMFKLAEVTFLEPNGYYGKKKNIVCQACEQTARDFGMEARTHPSVGQNTEPLLFLGELRSILQPQPYSLHNIDDAAATDLLRAVAERNEPE